jgi:hypothetical protein
LFVLCWVFISSFFISSHRRRVWCHSLKQAQASKDLKRDAEAAMKNNDTATGWALESKSLRSELDSKMLALSAEDATRNTTVVAGEKKMNMMIQMSTYTTCWWCLEGGAWEACFTAAWNMRGGSLGNSANVSVLVFVVFVVCLSCLSCLSCLWCSQWEQVPKQR